MQARFPVGRFDGSDGIRICRSTVGRFPPPGFPEGYSRRILLEPIDDARFEFAGSWDLPGGNPHRCPILHGGRNGTQGNRWCGRCKSEAPLSKREPEKRLEWIDEGPIFPPKKHGDDGQNGYQEKDGDGYPIHPPLIPRQPLGLFGVRDPRMIRQQ